MTREAFEAWFTAYYIKHGFVWSKEQAWDVWQAATAHARDVAVGVCESVSHDNPMTATDCADAIKEALK